jgi:hypothetical protein
MRGTNQSSEETAIAYRHNSPPIPILTFLLPSPVLWVRMICAVTLQGFPRQRQQPLRAELQVPGPHRQEAQGVVEWSCFVMLQHGSLWHELLCKYF